MKMKTVIYINDLDLQEIKQRIASFVSDFSVDTNNLDIILTHPELSRLSKGVDNTKDLLQQIKYCNENGICPSIEWDILMKDKQLARAKEIFEELGPALSGVNAIRVLDLGAVYYLREDLLKKFNNLKLHLLLGNGTNNYQGILFFRNLLGEKLERVILAPQTTLEMLKSYCDYSRVFSELRSLQMEILGLGPLLLMYTPRFLLSRVLGTSSPAAAIWAESTTSECDSVRFKVTQNQHGTMVYDSHETRGLAFLEKLFNEPLLADFKEQICVRFDFRLSPDIADISDIVERGEIETVCREGLREFLDDQDNFLGEVVAAVKGQRIALVLKDPINKLCVGDNIELVDPGGKHSKMRIEVLWDFQMREIYEAFYQDLVFIKFIPRVTPRTKVFLVRS
ncbi:MAG: U32 family peptidase [Oligoflexia bacterium]|nr:U32 family peptidase [Oligoflexia bacterium]